MPRHRLPRLTPTEEVVLQTLQQRPAQVTHYLVLARAIYGVSADEADIPLVQGFAASLRTKIEPDPRSPRFIVNRFGEGYAYYENGYVPAGLSELAADDGEDNPPDHRAYRPDWASPNAVQRS